MTGDKNKFISLNLNDGGSVTFGNDAPCAIKGKRSIALGNQAVCEDVYWVEGLKYNLMSVAQLNNKGYLLEFGQGSCVVRNQSRAHVATSRQSKGNPFYLDSMEGAYLIASVKGETNKMSCNHRGQQLVVA